MKKNYQRFILIMWQCIEVISQLNKMQRLIIGKNMLLLSAFCTNTDQLLKFKVFLLLKIMNYIF